MNSAARWTALNLKRSLIRCTGNKGETSQFLQGLVTNDINHFENGSASIYALFLNKLGRVLYDTIIYKPQAKNPEHEEFLIECDSQIVSNLTKHLKLYRVRRKIDINDVSDELNLWFLQQTINTKLPEANNIVSISTDPRMKDFGIRLITVKDDKIENSLKGLQLKEISYDEYTQNRYKLGICEGIVEIPPEKSFPLESNCDYMHGVSFQKGCYIGQELTARTHHTGVVRKRIMPLEFNQQIAMKDGEVLDVKNEENENVGKIRNVSGKFGLGLLRIDQVLSAKSLTVNENQCSTAKPRWWPKEASKTSQIPKN